MQTNLQNTEAKLTASDYTNLTKHDVVGDLLQSGVMSFMAMTHIQSQLSAQSSDIVYYREPSYGTFSTNARINYLFGQPQNVEMTGLLMDMDRMKSSAECKINCWEDWRDFNQSSGATISAYEHLIPEQLFSTDTDPVEGVSAVKALAIASAQGQRIYTIDQSNLSTALAALTFDDDGVKQEIQTQVGPGFVVTVHRDELVYAGWRGVGYTVVDPQTGSGAYKISGGSDGSETDLNTPEDSSNFLWNGILNIIDQIGNSADKMAVKVSGWINTVLDYMRILSSCWNQFELLTVVVATFAISFFAAAFASILVAAIATIWIRVVLLTILSAGSGYLIEGVRKDYCGS